MASRVLPHLEKTMSASEFRIPYQQTTENAGQFKICRCGEGDPNTNTSETGDKSPTSCPNCQNAPPRGNEPIVTLGGIDLNNSGSVVVKEDKKLLTVLFPDGRDGRTFTLKAETTEELNEWRSALENALAQAPVVANTVGQNPIFSTDIAEPAEAPAEQSDNKSIIGRPAEFALVDADGSPAFLEKALKFIEDYGVKVEGILRQSADVEEVKRRVRDYEKGKNEFSPEEDAHVIGDCIKDLEDGSYSSDAYTESEDGDFDKEYSTDNDGPEEDDSYDSGEDNIEEGMDDDTEHSSGGSECDNNIKTSVSDDKVKSNNSGTASNGNDQGLQPPKKAARTGHGAARKDLSAEEIDYCSDDETLIEKLENSKTDLQSKITKEVENLRDQLQKERNLRVSLESGLMNLRRGQASFPSTIDNKTKADLEEVATAEADILNLKQKGSDLRGQLNNQVQMSSASLCDSCNKRLLNTDKLTEGEQSTTSSNVGPNSISDMVSATHMDSGAPSALAKLTNRLNFLKERRAILAKLRFGSPARASSSSSEERLHMRSENFNMASLSGYGTLHCLVSNVSNAHMMDVT
uniref:PH domain-containing protein n=1 Tax=Oryza nivara TaxID=4536 RepID=A0A0E0GJX5_ORYNI